MSIACDYRANHGRPKIQLALILFRAAQEIRSSELLLFKVASPFASALYRVIVEWILGIEIPVRTLVAPGLVIHHGVGLVVHADSRIGRGVVLRQGVTVGVRDDVAGAPTLEDAVNVGAGAAILGPILIGKAAIIGANAVVARSVASGELVRAPRSSASHPGDEFRT